MDLRNIILIVSFLICFVVPPVLAYFFGEKSDTKLVILATCVGGLVYIVSQKAIYALLVKSFAVLTSYDPMIMGNKWIFGSFMCIGSTLTWELVRFGTLLFFSKTEFWPTSVRHSFSFAMGDCWLMAIFGWGIYMCQLIKVAFFDSEYDLDYFYVLSSDLVVELLERIIVGVLIVGITFVMQYAIKEGKKRRYIPMVIFIRMFLALFLYFIPIALPVPKLVAEFFVCAIAVLLLLYGRIMLMAANKNR